MPLSIFHSTGNFGKAAVWSVFLLASALAWSCAPSSKPPAGSTFRVNLGTEPPSLDWSLATDHVSFNVIGNLMVGLTEFDERLEPAPMIASSWDIFDGGKRIVFRLRDDVLWSDGRRVVASDFEYSWKRLLDPKVASEYAYILFDIVNAEAYNRGKIADHARVGVKAMDDHTLEVRLAQPASYFIAITTFEVTFPQRRDLVEKFGPAWTEPGNLVTNGPFLLASWSHQNAIELAANPRFFLGTPAIERVRMSMVNEKTTALALYERGELDFIDNTSIPTLEKARLARLPESRQVPQLRGYYYGFITDRKPFDDARVRRAFSMAVDRTVFPKILHGGERPAGSWIPSGMLAHDDTIGLRFDPLEAKRLLAEAGYPEGKGFPRITLGYNTDDDHKLVAEAVQSMWQRNLNVLARLDNQEWKVYLSRLNNDPPHVFRLGWGADYPDPDNFMKLFTSSSGNNSTRWRNPAYDRLVGEAAREWDARKRVALYREAQRILCETDVPIMPFFTTVETTLLSPRFTGLQLNSMARLALRDVRPTAGAPR